MTFREIGRVADLSGSGAASVGAPPLLLRVGLFVTVALIGAGLVEPEATKFAVLLHMLLRVYDGRFSGWRRVTWLVLMVGAFLSFAVGFLGYVLPWGQFSFWLAAHFGEPGWLMVQTFAGSRPIIGGVLWLALVADMVALHATELNRRRLWRTVAVLAVVFVTPGVAFDVLHLTGLGRAQAPSIVDAALTPRKIVPDLDELPLLAVFRAVPSKGLGVALVILQMLLPVTAVWSRAWRFHAPETRLVWTLATAAVAASFVGLGLLGARPPDTEGLQWMPIALFVYQLVFFIALPFVLGHYARPIDRRAVVFD